MSKESKSLKPVKTFNVEDINADNSMDYLNSIINLEESQIELNFDTEMYSEFSIASLLEHCGFSPKSMGYKYILKILSVCVTKMQVPTMIKGLYDIAVNYYNTKKNNVESSIRVAIKESAKQNKLANLNKIFKSEYVDEYITNGDFLNFLANRLILVKKYNEKIKCS